MNASLSQADRSFIGLKWLLIKRQWSKLNLTSLLQSQGFLILLAIFWFLCFQGVSRLCANIYSIDPIIGPLLLARFISFGFFAAFLIVVGGHVLTAYSTLFRGAHLPPLAQSPYPFENIFRIQCGETLIRGGWGLGLFSIPILLAYGVELNAPISYYPIMMLGLLAFLIIAGMTGILIMILIARWILGRPMRMMAGSTIVVTMFLIAAISIAAANRELFMNIDPARLGEVLANLRLSSNPYLPNHWFSELMSSARLGILNKVILYFLLLCSTAFILWCIAMELGMRWYADAWLWSQERSRMFNSRRDAKPFRAKRIWLTRLLPSRIGSILFKEIHLFFRDFSQWGQLTLILALILFYMVHIQNFSFEEPETKWRTAMMFFNLILLGFIQATLSLRYSFPSISLEGKGFWVVKSSAIGVRGFFFTKYYLHAGILLVIGLVMGFLLNRILDVDSAQHMISAAVLSLFAFGFTSWTMGMGAVFHNFNVTNATEVSSGTGALVTMILTLIYYGFSVALLAGFAMHYTPGVDFPTLLAMHPDLIILAALFLALQTGAILFPIIYGIEKLQQAEL